VSIDTPKTVDMNATIARHNGGAVHNQRTRLKQGRVGFSIAALLVWLVAGAPLHAAPQQRAGVLESLPQVWRDDAGGLFNLRALGSEPVVLTMAYATCHRICPTTMQQLQRLQERFDARGVAAEFVIVGYDPETDDAAAWRRYRHNRHLTRANWHFLVGSPQQVNRFAHVLGFEFWKADDHVMHDSRIVYLAPQGALQVDPGPDELRLSTTE
jgi:cytochrome oxidase Cu insertion factor (SCO1/SenC/PrrC family)